LLDLAIKGGQVCVPSGLIKTDIAVKDGKVVALGSASLFQAADKTIDASDKIVLPGLIDTHAHFREPGLTHKEDFTTGSMAAAAGGVTTFFDMPNVKPPTNTVERFREKRKIAKQKSIVDFNHIVGVTDNRSQKRVAGRGENLVLEYRPLFQEIPKLARAGAAGFKIFMADGVYPHPSELFVDDDGILLDLFEVIVKAGLVVSVHPLDKSIYDNDIRKMNAKGRKDPIAFYDVRARYDGISMTSGVARLLPLQKVTGVKLNLLHVYTNDSLELIRSARKSGQRFTTEANPQHLFFRLSDVKKLGPFAVTATTPTNREALWAALFDGTIDLIATDHAPHLGEEMESGWKDINGIPYGEPGIQEYLSLLLTEVNRGRLPLERLSKLCSENPARTFGIYPRKGAIKVGSDADFAVVDMKREQKIRPGYSKCGWTPYEGWRVKGLPVKTIVRGTVVMDDGTITVKPGFGDWIPGPGCLPSKDRLTAPRLPAGPVLPDTHHASGQEEG